MLGRAVESETCVKPIASEASTKARIDGVFSFAVRWRIGSGPLRPCQA